MKILTFIIALCIPLTALYLGLQISPTIGNILLSPISFISSIFSDFFTTIPYQIKASFIFVSGILYFLMFYFLSKLFFKKFSN